MNWYKTWVAGELQEKELFKVAVHEAGHLLMALRLGAGRMLYSYHVDHDRGAVQFNFSKFTPDETFLEIATAGAAAEMAVFGASNQKGSFQDSILFMEHGGKDFNKCVNNLAATLDRNLLVKMAEIMKESRGKAVRVDEEDWAWVLA